jgi:hypothetical protein
MDSSDTLRVDFNFVIADDCCGLGVAVSSMSEIRTIINKSLLERLGCFVQ